MNKKTLSTALAGLLAVGLLLGSTSIGPAQQFEACLSDPELQSAVAGGQIASLGDVLNRNGYGREWTPVSVRVCISVGQSFYVVSLRQGNQVVDVTLAAS
jgi:hypothetical protein